MNMIKSLIVAVLIWESRVILAKYKPFVVAITGSVGKTSTKDAIFSVLKEEGMYVRKAEKSMNSDIGLPLTVIGVPNAWRNIGGWMRNIVTGLKLIIGKHEYPSCLVLELGADHPGDIRNVAKWLKPDIAVITQVSPTPVHVEFFSSPEEVFEEKASLATAVKEGGTLVLFSDNQKVSSIAERVKGRNVQVLRFGLTDGADVKGSEYETTYEMIDVSGVEIKVPTGCSFHIQSTQLDVRIGVKKLIGTSFMFPLLAASAVGVARKMPAESIVKGLNKYDGPKGRMNIIAGLNGSTIIDDTYNSSPDAVHSALMTLKNIETVGSKIAVLGDMLELGQYASEEHRQVGKEVVGIAGLLVTVGPRSHATAEEAVKQGMAGDKVKVCDTSTEAGTYLSNLINPGDVVLIKGSQSIRMERTVKMLMKYPDQAEKYLVRQEQEWLEKK